MSKRWTQAEQLMWSIFNLRKMFNQGRGLEFEPEDNTITYNNNLVGYVLEDYEKMDHAIIVLTLQNHVLPNRVRKTLALEANENQLKVAFIAVTDIGFGIPKPKYHTIAEIKRLLRKVAKYSQDDVKTAVLVGESDHATRPTKIAPIAFSYNQMLDGYADKFHAEATLAELVNVDLELDKQKECWFMELEPCKDCLQDMVESGARNITFTTAHKEKWNTEEYIKYVDDLYTKTILNKNGLPVIYKKETML